MPFEFDDRRRPTALWEKDMGRTRKYGFDFLKTLSQKIGDLSGFVLMCRELVQNADDEKCEWISFDFMNEALVVRNPSMFTVDDFNHIMTIGSEGKIQEAEKTGRFGVGFVSVFQICDHPIIFSNGTKLTICPEDQKAIEEDGERSEGTEFHLKWAKDNSAVRDGLKKPTVTNENINKFEEDLIDSIFHTMLFLKNIRQIRMTWLNGDEFVADRQVDDGHWRTIKLYKNRKVIDESDWLIFENQETKAINIAGVERSDAMGVAFPLMDNDKHRDIGIVFCTLPTRTPTGLPISVNADFAIKSDRSSIVDEGISPEVNWNRTIIYRLGDLYVEAIMEARDLVSDKDFSKLLPPVNYRNPSCEILEGISKRFFDYALNKPVIKVVDGHRDKGKWILPSDARLLSSVTNPELFDCLSELNAPLVIPDLQNRWNLMVQRLKTKTLTLRDLPDFLDNSGIIPGLTSNELPKTIQNRNNLKALWDFVGSELEKNKLSRDIIELASSLPLCPCEDGRFMPFGKCYEVKSDILSAAPVIKHIFPIVESHFGSEYQDLSRKLCEKKDLDLLLELMEGKTSQEVEKLADEKKIEMLQLYDCLSVREKDLRSRMDLRDRLAALEIYPARGKAKFCSMSKLFLPGEFVDPIGLEIILDTRNIEDIHLGIFRCLGLKELNIKNYVKRIVPDYFNDPFEFGEKDKRYELLKIIRERFLEIETDTQAIDLVKGARCIYCNDGHYQRPSDVYLDFDGLEEVLSKYPRPNEIYGHPIKNYWFRFFSDLGANKKPKILDVVREIRTITALDFDEGLPLIEELFYYLAKRFQFMDHNEKKLTEQVRSIEWLPVVGDHRYDLPGNLYLNSLAKLVGQQGSLLRFSRENLFAGEFRRHIGLLERPFANIIIRNLQDLRNNNKKPDLFIYRALNDLVDKLEPRDKETLATDKLVYINSSSGFVQGSKVFWGSHPFEFYRFRLPSGLREFPKLMSAVMGVKDNAVEADFFEVLFEISNKYRSFHEVLEEKDVSLINYIYAHFTNNLAAISEDERTDKESEWHELLKDEPVILTRSGQLRSAKMSFFADKEWAVKVFKDKVNDLLVDKDPKTWPFLNAIGVRPLSAAVKVENFKEPPKIEVSPLQNSLRSRGREKELRRIIETHKSAYPGHHWRLDTLLNAEIAECEDLEVEFSIDINGRKIPSGLQHPDSHFDLDTSNLYILQNLPDEIKLLETARKLANLLNPKIDASILCSQIRYAINPMHSDSELHKLLTYMGIDEVVEHKIIQDDWNQDHKGDAESILDENEEDDKSQSSIGPETGDNETDSGGGFEKTHSEKSKKNDSGTGDESGATAESGKTNQEKRRDYFDEKRKKFYQDRYEFENKQPIPEMPEKQQMTPEEWKEHKNLVMVFYNRQIRNIERRLNRLQEGEESFDIYAEDWNEISQMIRERDGFKCRRCGATIGELEEIGSHLIVHHIVPRKKGGSNWPSNLISLCIACHREVEKEPNLL